MNRLKNNILRFVLIYPMLIGFAAAETISNIEIDQNDMPEVMPDLSTVQEAGNIMNNAIVSFFSVHIMPMTIIILSSLLIGIVILLMIMAKGTKPSYNAQSNQTQSKGKGISNFKTAPKDIPSAVKSFLIRTDIIR